MPHGQTLILNAIDRMNDYRKPEPRPARERDRSLAGKDRIRARKAAKAAARAARA